MSWSPPPVGRHDNVGGGLNGAQTRGLVIAIALSKRGGEGCDKDDGESGPSDGRSVVDLVYGVSSFSFSVLFTALHLDGRKPSRKSLTVVNFF